jgi:hypothetical protein
LPWQHVHNRQIVDDPDKLAVAWTEEFLLDRQRLLVVLFGFDVLAHRHVGARKVLNGDTVICVGGA